MPGEHTAECEGEKGINRQPQAVTPPAGGYGQETKVRWKRRELEPAKAADRQAPWNCAYSTGQAQTGIVPIRPWFSAPRASARCEGHGVKYRPKATKMDIRNGETPCGSPHGGAGNQLEAPREEDGSRSKGPE
jgi:hypothetical protein